VGNKTKRHTQGDHQSSAFKVIFVMEFINMGLIVMIQGLNIFDGLNEWLFRWTGIQY
jgi:hypothetical protein